MAFTRYYFRGVAPAAGVGPSGEQASNLTVWNVGSTWANGTLELTKGSTNSGTTQATDASNSSQAYLMTGDLLTANPYGACVSPAIGATLATLFQSATIWNVGLAGNETNAAANFFYQLCIYLWTSGGTLRGRIYDPPASTSGGLGVELSTTSAAGQVITDIAGAGVAGAASTDRLCVELWIVTAGQSMATAYSVTFKYEGSADVVDGAALNYGSWIEFDAAAGGGGAAVVPQKTLLGVGV